jgi:uncharacterized GH25 family protein
MRHVILLRARVAARLRALAMTTLQCIVTLAMAMLAHSASAHDFWLQPTDFWFQPDVQTPMTLQVGHGPHRQRSPISLSRIRRFDAVGPAPGAVLDLRGQLDLGGSQADGQVKLHQPGTYLLVLETDNRAQSHQPAERFNEYLKVEGLTAALNERQQGQRMDEEGSESYSRVAKAIVQIGDPSENRDSQVTRESGLPLEIVLEKNPYAEPRAATLPARVLYQGKPLVGASVKLTNLEHDETPVEVHLTDPQGRALFLMPTRGKWMLNVIWTRPISGETDFATVFSSLSFGFP